MEINWNATQQGTVLAAVCSIQGFYSPSASAFIISPVRQKITVMANHWPQTQTHIARMPQTQYSRLLLPLSVISGSHLSSSTGHQDWISHTWPGDSVVTSEGRALSEGTHLPVWGPWPGTWFVHLIYLITSDLMRHCFADIIFIGYLHSITIYLLFIELQSISSLMMPVLL